jgi:hypothetical protein
MARGAYFVKTVLKTNETERGLDGAAPLYDEQVRKAFQCKPKGRAPANAPRYARLRKNTKKKKK